MNPADSAEHRFKETDVRTRVPGLSRKRPVYGQQGRATNIPIGSASSRNLKFKKSICRRCNDTLTQPYDEAWQTLSAHLHGRWRGIAAARRFDLSKPFPGRTRAAALNVHLYFVKLFGCLIVEGNVPIDLKPFSYALLNRQPHSELCLQIINAAHVSPIIAAQASDLYAMRNQHAVSTGPLGSITSRRLA